MKENYPKAYTEVIEILKYVPQESVNKIPKELIDTLEYKKDKNYIFIVDENKKFEEQIILAETKAILANIFRDYWATPEQRERIINKQNQDRKIIEEQKKCKYDSNNIFKNNKENKNGTDIKLKNAYIEVNQILNLLGDEYKKKIPEKLINLFNQEQDNEYKTNISKHTKIEDIKVSREALIIISILNFKYWETNEQNRIKLKNAYDANELKYKEKINNYENTNESKIEIKKEMSLIPRDKLSIFDKIKSFFIKLLNRRK